MLFRIIPLVMSGTEEGQPTIQEFNDRLNDLQVSWVSEVLDKFPEFDINAVDDTGKSALCCACEHPTRADILRVIINHPDIRINDHASCRFKRNSHTSYTNGFTPLMITGSHDNLTLFKILILDIRTDLNTLSGSMHPLLYWLSMWGKADAIEMMIASGKPFGLNKVRGDMRKDDQKTVLEISRDQKITEVVSILERYTLHPEETRFSCMKKIFPNEMAASAFALVVFECDGLLRLKPNVFTVTRAFECAAARFIAINRCLPIELQHLICNTYAGLTKGFIAVDKSEDAFKKLAKCYVK